MVNAGEPVGNETENRREGGFHKRPLSLTILGWGWFAIALVSMTVPLFSDEFLPTNTFGLPSLAFQVFEFFLNAFTVLCSLGILRGKAWARAVFTVLLVVELLRMLVLDWPEVLDFLHMDIALSALALWALYRPAGRVYFGGTGAKSPLTYQMGTAICYLAITCFLTIALGMPATVERQGLRAFYLGLFALSFAGATYGTGNALRVVLNPQRHVGVMLMIAAVAQALFVVGAAIDNADGFGGLYANGTEPRISIGICFLVTVVFYALGWFLYHRSTKVRKQPLPLSAESRT